MNYYERHIGDYLKDTHHLSLIEHGVYTRLLDVYYTKEEPIPASQVERLVGARSKDEKAALSTVLAEFFVLENDAYCQIRCDREIARYREKQRKASASAKARWENTPAHTDGNANAMRTHSEGNAPNPQSPVTSNQSPNKKKEIHAPDGVSQEVWDSFVAQRKASRSAITDGVIKTIGREASKAGWSLENALAECAARGWRGFKADWVAEKQATDAGGRNRAVMSGLTRGLIGGAGNVKLLG